jgi:hypothetical protein
MDERERAIYQNKIVVGELAKRFLEKELADYLIRKAHEDVEAAISQFLDLDPHDAKAITLLQVKVKTALAALQWMNEAIDEGAKALDEYMQRKEIEKDERQPKEGESDE